MKNAYKLESDVVTNIISVDPESEFDFVSLGYVLDETNLIQIGWVKSGSEIVAPPASVVSPSDQVEAAISKCISFGNNLFLKYSTQNALAGIGSSGKRKLVADTLRDVHFYAQVGLLAEMIDALEAVVVTSEMAPFITDAIIANFIQQIQDFLVTLNT